MCSFNFTTLEDSMYSNWGGLSEMDLSTLDMYYSNISLLWYMKHATTLIIPFSEGCLIMRVGN